MKLSYSLPILMLFQTQCRISNAETHPATVPATIQLMNHTDIRIAIAQQSIPLNSIMNLNGNKRSIINCDGRVARRVRS